jgi:GMP synthase (glutamine-hydrolysing)
MSARRRAASPSLIDSSLSKASRMPHVLIVDFGSQVTQLIARRVRESGVYAEIHPFSSVDQRLHAFAPRA